MSTAIVRPVEFTAGDDVIHGDPRVPPQARGLVIFAHGSWFDRYLRPPRP